MSNQPAIKRNAALRENKQFFHLYDMFLLFKESWYEGVRGVIKTEGGKPGPTLGISVCTHGDEPAGLAVAEYVLTEVASNQRDLSGTIILVLNNFEATDRYFNASSGEERRESRFSDVNMNRIPDDALKNENDARYEIARTRELLPIFEQFDVGIDIHSTTQESEPMIIALGNDLPVHLVRGMPIQKIISNIDAIQTGKPVSHFYGPATAKIPRFGIEAGSHEDQRSFNAAVTCTQVLLGNLNMYEKEQRKQSSQHEEYLVYSSVIFPNESYELVQLFENFEFIPKGTVLARGDGPQIVAEEDCHALFASRTKPLFFDEEVMFLTKPARIISDGKK